MPEIILIAAMAENRVIGKNNAMPWSIKGNLARFKEMTMGFPCIMGRKTWDSLPKKPLPGRLNIIISKTMNAKDNPSSSLAFLANANQRFDASWREIIVFQSLSSAVEHCFNYEKIFICGGESIYKQAMPIAAKIDLTLIPGQYDGDTYFPQIDDTWEKTETVKHDEFSIVTYIKKEQK
ncbi:MAG: dihydrofolate reductase [Treponema sp.]|nr:dihydrofolate reductase [Treponema sp.]